MRLTSATPAAYKAGSAFSSNPIFLPESGSFSTSFRFQISDSGGMSDEDGIGADGLAFVIHTATNGLGASGGYLGYGGLDHSIAIEFDTFNNGAWDQDDGNHVGIALNGDVTAVLQQHVAARFSDGNVWQAWIDYYGGSDRLEVRLSETEVRPVLPTLSTDISLAAILGQSVAFVGFSSGTAAGYGNHDILSWQLSCVPGSAPAITSVSPNPVTGSNSQQPFTINGSNFVSGCNVTLRDLTAGLEFERQSITSFSSTQIRIDHNFGAVGRTWSVEVVNPDGHGSGPFDFAVRAPGEAFYLSFPLAGLSPYTASIASVFDHSMITPYCPDGVVTAYSGESGTVVDENEPPMTSGSSCPDQSLFSYKKADGTPFILNGHYVGTRQTGPSTLNYDGHPGVDYPVVFGTDVFAAAKGVLHWIPGSLFNTIYIDHENGYTTHYLHLSQRLVADSTTVSRGQHIALSGEAGAIGSPHLHFEVKHETTPVDPYGWEEASPDPYTAGISVNLWDSVAAPQITSISPNPAIGAMTRQTITINGANFLNKPTVTLAWTISPLPPPGGYLVPNDQVIYISSTQLRMSIVTSTESDTWTVKVTNPDGQSSVQSTFAVNSPTSTLTEDDVARVAYGAGFRGGALVNAVAVAKAESDFVLTAIHYNNNGTVDRGLWQINSIHSYDPQLLLSSASYNASAAYEISKAALDANWTPWVTFNNGDFTNWLTIARNAAQDADSRILRSIGDRIFATETTRVRPNPGDPVEAGTVVPGVIGTVVDGPVVATIGAEAYRYIWWNIDWDDGGSDGWSAENYLARAAYTLVLNPNPSESGSITADRSPEGDGKYVDGTLVSLTAHPIDGYFLRDWSGVDSFDGDTAAVSMSAPRTVTAHFNLIQANTSCGCPAEYLSECSSVAGLADRSPKANVESAGAPASPEEIDLTLIRRFRDEILVTTPHGRAIIDMFYHHSPEILHHLLADAELQHLSTTAIVSLQPVMHDLITGGGDLILTTNQTSAVNALLTNLNEVAGVELRSAIAEELDRIGDLGDLAGKTSQEAQQIVLGLPLRIVNTALNANGDVVFTVEGELSGTVDIEYSDDLMGWITLDLAPGAVVANPNGTVTVSVPAAADSVHRFYRAISP